MDALVVDKLSAQRTVACSVADSLVPELCIQARNGISDPGYAPAKTRGVHSPPKGGGYT